MRERGNPGYRNLWSVRLKTTYLANASLGAPMKEQQQSTEERKGDIFNKLYN
jgi:hypothetical protein